MIKVTVLMGGISSEREVSISSGKAVSEALKKAGYNVDEIQITDELLNPEKLNQKLYLLLFMVALAKMEKFKKFSKIIILFLLDLHPPLVIYPLINFYLEKY